MLGSFFEIKAHDLAARIGKLKTNHGVIETPNILPVINPNKTIVTPGEMKEMGFQAVITNAYILWKDFREEAIAKGVHGLLDFNGPVMTDSGAFQLMQYGGIDVSNEEIIKFQEDIGVDIGVILDIPTKTQDYETMKANVEETLSRARQSQELIKDSQTMWAGPIQGGVHLDLLEKSASEMSKMNFQVHPIGSVVPLLVKYEFAQHVDMIRTVKDKIPSNRVVHLFGAGHPMFFAFAVAMGVDLFDSAAYALYAKEGRYLTETGTKHVSELDYLPCSCPVCSTRTPGEMTEKDIAMHNLYVTLEELKRIKQAIKDNSLWELLEQKAFAHPKLFKTMQEIMKQTDYFNKTDPVTKQHFFYNPVFSEHRTEFKRVKERVERIKSSDVQETVFGKVPSTVLECYPFTQTVSPDDFVITPASNGLEKIRDVSLYWFGVNVFPEKVRIRTSKKTGKIREVYEGRRLLAVFRASDFKILLHDAAEYLFEKTDKYRVVVKEEAVPFIKQGKSAFAKHVVSSYDFVPGQEALVVSESGELIAAGEALLSGKEMKEFERGPAVKIRWVKK